MNPEPRFVELPIRRMAGLVERHPCNDPSKIPAQWERFGPFIPCPPNGPRAETYGICSNFDDTGHFDYMAAFEIGPNESAPVGLTTLELHSEHYAVYRCEGHISEIASFIGMVWGTWIPQSGLKPTQAPAFERYGPEYDPKTGNGGFDLWVPVTPPSAHS